ncbi:hypothetical protein MEG1DRAFT_02505 [Photorhabdus temperata subsp. temperata Meg1]|uniref:Uncharacterized protein n=1 Tax=Photorhabdus temperata subsp. temperata Meg1 TaxID=1393735 RepID=A0A081RVS3_PHOTE|nr:hypothetical protein MEG1DRAFT_02505 [Photorhabdus temperata subsp. temperata Meg1]
MRFNDLFELILGLTKARHFITICAFVSPCYFKAWFADHLPVEQALMFVGVLNFSTV